jgi:hypothetical protein
LVIYLKKKKRVENILELVILMKLIFFNGKESPPLVTLQVAGKSPSSSLACLQPLQDGLQAMARHPSPPVAQVPASDVDVEANDVKINGNHLAADAEMTSISEAGKDLLIDQLPAPPAPSFS